MATTTYVLPQAQVFQDVATVPAAAANPQPAHIAGGQAHLVRYAQASERAHGRLGYYDGVVDQVFAWPGRPAGGVIDPGYTKLWMQDALLPYYTSPISSGTPVTKLAGHKNRIRSAATRFAANGAYARAAALLDRDVRPGDVVQVRGVTSGGDPVTLWTSVQALLPDVVASSVLPAQTDASNPATQSRSAAVAYVSGARNCVSATADATAYSGLASGQVVETYDLLVVGGSVGGDFTTATLRVISGSGTDDQAAVTPAATGDPTTIGTRGLAVTFDFAEVDACLDSASLASVAPDDLIPGQRWQVTVHDAFTAPVPTAGGTYLGTNDTTYIATVVRGGTYAGAIKPQIIVTTTTGVDISGPTAVAAAATPVAAGTLGATIRFGGTGLRKGDRYYIPVVGQSTGPVQTLILNNNLDVDIPDGAALDVTLSIRVPVLQVGQDRLGSAPLTNWDQDDLQLTVTAGITTYDPTWTSGGVPQPLPVASAPAALYGVLYAEYRAWIQDLVADVGSISDPGRLDAQIKGALDPDNPLKWGVFQALTNANGSVVKYSGIAHPDDPTAWADMLAMLLGRADTYELVPLTKDPTVLDLYAAHVKAQSSPLNGLWRVAWFNLAGIPAIPVVAASSAVPGHLAATTSDGEVALAVVEDDPFAAGTQYTIVRVTSGNAQFLTNAVRPGDLVRMLYTGDGFGHATYTTHVVDEVQSEEQLRLLVGPAAPISVAAQVEVWRNLTADEEAAAIALAAGAWGDRRIRATWPDRVEGGGTLMDGTFLNCALAGLAAGVLPHQGLTNVAIVGFTSVKRTTAKFGRDQLNTMAVAGVWIVTQDPNSGHIFTRHAVTTGLYEDINQREEVFTRNLDNISYRFKDTFAPFIGIANVTPSLQARLRIEISNLIDSLKTVGRTIDLGPQLIGATISYFGPSATLRDRYILSLACDLPYPFNTFEIHLVSQVNATVPTTAAAVV